MSIFSMVAITATLRLLLSMLLMTMTMIMTIMAMVAIAATLMLLLGMLLVPVLVLMIVRFFFLFVIVGIVSVIGGALLVSVEVSVGIVFFGGVFGFDLELFELVAYAGDVGS